MRTGCEPTRFGNEAKTIILGDALTELKKLPAESVDLIFADPPYNIGKNFDGLIEAWKEDLFIDWLFEVIAECHRVLKKQGSMYIMNSTENMPFIDLQCRKLFTIKSRIVWSYDSSGVQAKKHYGSMYEPILMMVKDAKNYTFNGDAILVEAKTGSQRALINYRKNPPQPYNHQKVPGNVWDFPRVRYLMDEYENHPTQKPEALLKRIILASSNPGDIVLDPFAGSFTTGAVAVASGRKFIGIEINSEYIKMGLRRSVRPNGLEDTAQFKLEVDQEKAQALGVSLSDINQTISTALGGTYVNDFIDRGRVKKVYVQADAKFRMLPEDVDKLYVRSANGEMVPFSAFTTSHWVYGSPRLERYNGLPSMEIQGEAAPGTSSGDAMALMENLASKLPAGIGYDWTGMSYQERLSGNQAPALVAISFVVVFLCLAALYESWSIPVSVMLVVPLGIVGVLLAATLFNQKNDVYFMVGLLTTIGLSAKNAILIVEFAKDLMEKEGKGVVEATLMAVRMRLRPILMTSLAFILGVLPLAISNGAGSGAQNAVGIGVMGGMVSATLLAIFFVPVFFVVIRRCFKG